MAKYMKENVYFENSKKTRLKFEINSFENIEKVIRIGHEIN